MTLCKQHCLHVIVILGTQDVASAISSFDLNPGKTQYYLMIGSIFFFFAAASIAEEDNNFQNKFSGREGGREDTTN